MQTVSRIKKTETNTLQSTNNKSNYTYEVVVVEDNHLTNTILSKALDSTIKTIYNLKNISVKFSSFQNGQDFLNYFESTVFQNSKLIVFSDYYLEDNMNGVEILKNIKQKKAESTVIIMSDSPNSQIPIDAEDKGAYCFIPKNHKTPVICSELLSQMIS